ncbi:Arm DNA-binding domain-containing protein [Paenibacillus sp. NPDC093718]|uniref:Arm DNA-binding domain-containing protein n=1 Tax=Paenibacillus sp. NPDC093718 TaxID=3390601 RepID=UPI003CFF7C9F
MDLNKDEVTGKRKQKLLSGYDRKRDAERAPPGVLSDFIKGTFVEPSKITFGEIMETWLKDKKLQ